MRAVHAQLRAHAGESDPLAAIARGWRRQFRVLVLDEFFVSDIGDAMLLSRLLDRLFDAGVVLVTTSNTPPGQLYRGGLQRVRFEPAITLLQRHCVVLQLDSPHDYRLRALTRSSVYHAPLDANADAWLADGLAWFDFPALCEGPRAAGDYIEIAREFHTVLLGGVPVLRPGDDDAARRFVTLVDELYDRHVNLVCTADAAPASLYVGERLAGAFERTASRLVEMQSEEYLALEHRG